MKAYGRIGITLTERHADGYWPTRDAEMLVYMALSGAPADAQVKIDVGPVRYPSSRMVEILTGNLGPDAVLIIEGTAEHVARWLEAFNPGNVRSSYWGTAA